ncbi:endonuclease III [candidate division WOR-3 bacterium]|nr:endonuclease III [candidate division WOR-3 bacterium]
MTKKERAVKIYEILSKLYPHAKCHLNYKKPYELLLSGILSAQTLDSRVNSVTPVLFKRYPGVNEISRADPEILEEILKPVGMYRMKSARIIGAASFLKQRYNGEVPETIEDLIRIPGVGRKTANLFVGEFLGKPAIIADTHLIRVTARLGLVEEHLNPEEIEFKLVKIVPDKIRTGFSFVIGDHGRNVCKARKPNCAGCEISKLCKKAQQDKKNTQ